MLPLIGERKELIERYSLNLLSPDENTILSCGKMRHAWGNNTSQRSTLPNGFLGKVS
ncbi:hypothetical protein [Lentibacillus halodurans]|uniref:hypothetical protein n=1 Tax=Lentibacillus halodurans TaxID=237679 RepID=UPI001479AAB4|nr:hypothetical protein [Lentibacillus halodurans]